MYMNTINSINVLKTKIFAIKRITHFLYYTPMTKEMAEQQVENLKKLGIDFDINGDTDAEVNRILTMDVPLLENDLVYLETDFNNMIKRSQGKDYNFFDDGLNFPYSNSSTVLKIQCTEWVYIVYS